MQWNWQHTNWPHFKWDAQALQGLEANFLHDAGLLLGASKHFGEDERLLLTVDLITSEAVKTSEIEGEYLNRDSVQSSIRRHFGLETDHRRVEPAERGIAEMMVDLYKHYDAPLIHRTLYNWHKMITNGRRDLNDIGRYRTHDEPMQVISGRLDKPNVHFEAPPSNMMKAEMDAFLAWFKSTTPKGRNALPALTRAGLAHLYFVCIHPFEDGNGRISRAIAEKSLSETLQRPTMIALSQTIHSKRKAYYDALEANNKSIDITDWLIYFANTVLEAQSYSQQLIEFLLEKTKLYDRVRGKLNDRQEKVIERMFREGLEGFEGGLSADNYLSITDTSRATATRDLQALVDVGAFIKTGELKGTRYWLNIRRDRL